jgi:coenzyme PQQ precursor peptide PqqA
LTARYALGFSAIYRRRSIVTWKKPTLTEIRVGLEINDYFPAEI